MKKSQPCPKEANILNALKAGTLTPEMQDHIAHCPDCENHLLLYGFMNEFGDPGAHPTLPARPLPGAGEIWDQAFSPAARKRELAEKALRPVVFFQRFAIAAGVIFFILMAAVNFPLIRDTVTAKVGSNWAVVTLTHFGENLLGFFSLLVLIPLAVTVLLLVADAFSDSPKLRKLQH